MDTTARRGTLFVVSAPSGAGKHTILERVLARDKRLGYSVSATTRSPRRGEVDGTHYHFMDRASFERRVAEGDFVEWAEVHGNLYGTLRSELERLVGSGKDIVLELDVQGMRNVKRAGLDAVTVFIMAPTVEDLERRLKARATDPPEEISLRLANAKEELAARGEYDHVIVNADIDQATAEFEEIVRSARERAARTGKQE
ncbi:MAG: guanylate kinase [Candidatus Hydrogenedentota bacterium]